MAEWIKYRKNGGRVESSAQGDNAWPNEDPDIYGFFDTGIVKPPVPGQWCDGVTFRAATAPEIAAWPAKLAEDEDFLNLKATKAEIETDRPRRIQLKLMLREINKLRVKNGDPEYTWAQVLAAYRDEADIE